MNALTAGAYAPAPLKTRKIERSDLPRTAHAMLAYANGLRTRPLVDLQLEDLLIQGLILSSQTLEELRAVQDTLNALKQEYVRRDPRLSVLFGIFDKSQKVL